MSHSDFPIKLKEEHTPNAGFFQWLKTNTALFASQIAALISIILYIATFFYYVIGHDKSSPKTGADEYLNIATDVIYGLNIVFCSIFIIATIYIFSKNDEGEYYIRSFFKRIFDAELDDITYHRSIVSLGKFKSVFLMYWIYALIFYLVMAYSEAMIKNQVVTEDNIKFAKYLLNSGLMVFIFYLFRIMFYSRTNAESKFGSGEILISKLELFIFHWLTPLCFIVLYFTISTLIFVTHTKYLDILNALTGILNMISLSMLISRFDSKLIGLPSWLISILYGYAAVQALDFTFTKEDLLSKIITTSTYAITFLFKIYFFLIMVYSMQTGRLLSFFCSNGEMSLRLKKAKELMTQIKD